jgi:hypothetical protein
MTKTKSGRKPFPPLAIHFLDGLFSSAEIFPADFALEQLNPATRRRSFSFVTLRKKIVPPENKDPDISPKAKRARRKSREMFSGAGITAIYATQFKRYTANRQSLAEQLRVAVTQIEAKKTADLVAQMRKANIGPDSFYRWAQQHRAGNNCRSRRATTSVIPETEFTTISTF